MRALIHEQASRLVSVSIAEGTRDEALIVIALRTRYARASSPP
jgi:hypothetical protein